MRTTTRTDARTRNRPPTRRAPFAIDVSSVHAPGRSRNGRPPTMSVMGSKVPARLNSRVVPSVAGNQAEERAAVPLLASRRHANWSSLREALLPCLDALGAGQKPVHGFMSETACSSVSRKLRSQLASTWLRFQRPLRPISGRECRPSQFGLGTSIGSKRFESSAIAFRSMNARELSGPGSSLTETQRTDIAPK
jgi:hypothetical protein